MLVWEAEEAATYGMLYTRNPVESTQEHLKSAATQNPILIEPCNTV